MHDLAEDGIHEQVRAVVGEYGFVIAFYDQKTNSIKIPYLFEDGKFSSIDTFPLGEGLTSLLIRTREPLMLVEDTERRATAMGAKVAGKAAKSWLGVPMVARGEAIGAIIVQDLENENSFDVDDLRFLTAVANQISGTIHNVIIIEETKKTALQFGTAAQISRDISSSIDLDELLKKGVDLIRSRFNFYHAGVFLKDAAGEFVVIREATGEAGAQMKRAGHKLGKTVAGILGGNGITQNLTNTKLRSRRWWKTMPGLLAATECVVTAVIVLIVALYQVGFFDGKSKHPTRTQNHTESRPFKTEAVPVPSKPATPDREDQAPSVAKLTPSTPSSTSAINLLSSENGGHIIIGTNDRWRYAIDGDENNWQYIDSGVFGGWAVYGFKDERPAIFNTFKVLILGTESWNLKAFELLAGNDSATGTCESIRKFETQNVRFFKDPYQEFRFPAVKAKYLKIKVVSSHGFSSCWCLRIPITWCARKVRC